MNCEFVIKTSKVSDSEINKSSDEDNKKNVVLAVITINKMSKTGALSSLILDLKVTAHLVAN